MWTKGKPRSKPGASPAAKKKGNTLEPSSRDKEDALRDAFCKVLIKTPLGKVKFSEDFRRVTIKYFNDRFSYDIRIKTEVNVGSWEQNKPVIIVDDHMFKPDNMKSFKALCVHEAVEKYLVDKYGLDIDIEAHVVATEKEEEYLKRIGGNWRSHQLIVYHLWDKLDRH